MSKAMLRLILLCLLGSAMPALAATPGEVEIGGTLREATMQGLAGPSRKLSEFRGKPLLINVWASWCGPCRSEMGSLEQLFWRYEGKKFAMIGISTDDYPDKARAFLKLYPTSFAHFIDQRLLLENMLGANRLPLTVVVDARGRVVGKYYGARDWDSAGTRAMIGKALGIPMGAR
ncbi:MAG: TlpA disulfide reductase family protein [Hylemonella sp.]|nr:TlpA disulfide reductase family protein [Hylemonella sp.]